MSAIVAENGQNVTDCMLDEWCDALDRDEWPEGWRNVGEVVEGHLPVAPSSNEAPRTVDLLRMSSAEFARNIEEATAEVSRGEGLSFDEAVAQIRAM